MNLACEACGTASPAQSKACTQCGESFAFLSEPVAQWTPNDHSKWLYSQHFQIAERVDAEGLSALPRGQQLNYLVGYLYYQVANGGIWQYFENPCGPDAPQLVAALREIDSRELADLLDSCLDYFPNRQPQSDREQREAAVAAIPESTANQLHAQVGTLIFARPNDPDLLARLRKGIEAACSHAAPSQCGAMTS